MSNNDDKPSALGVMSGSCFVIGTVCVVIVLFLALEFVWALLACGGIAFGYWLLFGLRDR